MAEEQRETVETLQGNASSQDRAEHSGPVVDRTPARGPPDFLPIVAIGASAGGLEATSRLFDAISRSTRKDADHAILSDIAFLVVQHLDPTHPSLLPELLAQHTTMRVVEATDNCSLAPGHIYIIPPGRYLSVRAATLHLSAPQARHGSRMPFDFLLKSLADGCGPQTLGVVLSGTGTDGSLGLAAVEEAGGFVVAQDPAEAEYDGMPRSTIATAHVDRVLRLADMPAAFADHARQVAGSVPPPDAGARAAAAGARAVAGTEREDGDAFAAILAVLHEQQAQDFSQCNVGTIARRAERRMGLLGIERADRAGYLAVLRERPAECDLLAKDLLIHVTGFFRDARVFHELAKSIVPGLIATCAAQQTFRIWVAGCSTGEEAYSIAMVCRDAIAAANSDIKLQIFASDVDPDAIASARAGLYPFEIADTVAAAQLSRYFIREDSGYRITPELRGDVVFTVRDLLSDPPFSRIDMVSCRNVLIDLNPEAQAKVISLFHFALREGGILLLGASETVGDSSGRFEIIAKTERIYRHVARVRPGDSGFAPNFGETLSRVVRSGQAAKRSRQSRLSDVCVAAAIASHAPAAVLIDRQRQVLYSMGPTNRYLQLAPGYASQDLLDMAAPALRRKLKSAIEHATKVSEQVAEPSGEMPETTARTAPSNGQGARTRLIVDGKAIWSRIEVERLSGENKDLLMVFFVDEPYTDTVVTAAEGRGDDSRNAELAGRNAELERELEAARAELQASIQNEETSHQEHKAINEEALSVDEGYQSTIEELLTSKEELQSLNEELTARNGQLQETLDRQRLTSDDLQNVLYSTDVGTLFLDMELNIRFFTPAVSAFFHIIPGDIGRPLADLRSIAADESLLGEARKVAAGAATVTREVTAPGDIWFLRRIFPYLAHDGCIEGVVITFADITERKLTEDALKKAKLEAERANLAKSRFLAVASHDLRQPLQSLTLLKELLVQAMEGDKPRKLLARFEQTLRTISGMLNALLDINQIEAGVVQPKPMVFPLAHLFERMRDEFSYVAQARELSFRIVPTTVLVETDPRLLDQIIRNLLGNAVKYTEAGKILLGVRRHGESLRIEVGDTGIGIAEDQLQAIFEEFHQVGNEAREPSRGLGLGLSIVQRLGRLLGHAIDVRSVPGRGSLFGITVPMRPGLTFAPAGLAALSEATGREQQHRCKVIVVDDDPDILELLELLLKSEGYIVRVAGDAAAALKLVANGAIEPEILLTDYNLPGSSNGVELLVKLRTLLKHDLPAIILTGDIAAETMAAIALEDCIQLSKPVDPHELVQAIEQLRPGGLSLAIAGTGELASRFPSVTYVIDDDPNIRSTICEVLEGEGYVVKDFPSSEAFLAAYHPGGDGCLLVDAHLPGLSGVGLISALRERADHMPAILLTGDGDIGLAVEAMRAGACEYIEKPVGRAELLASITRAIVQSHDIRLVDAVHEGAAALVAELTARQREIMNLVLAGHPSKNIAADLGISQRTVENHRAAIMDRMGVKSLPELARLVVQAEAGVGLFGATAL